MTADPFDDAENADAVRLLAGVPPVEPSAGLFARILARLPGSADRSGFVFRTATDTAFKPTREPGVSVRMLYLDRPGNRFSAYLRLDPGASLCPHAHDGVEECVVLSGSIQVGDRLLRAGDYQRAEPGYEHDVQSSPDGCLLFLTGPLSLLGE